MNYLKTSPVGIDLKIDRIQKSIYTTLVEKWTTVDVYGRVYKNQKDNGTVLEVYTQNGEYQRILFNEGNKVFFVQGQEPINNLGLIENDLWAVAVVNLENIKPGITHRADEEARVDLFSALVSAVGRENITRLEYGLEKVKRVVEDNLSFENFKFSDVHPYHVFMVKMKVDYSLLINQC